ncbi:allantoin racemase [Acinetobacter calcoaceticus]|uniref:Allantoin racemase n=1 Tax=Acinetobacter calcoaceticus TaxID=471 RepID=A0A4R1Y7Y2_ACICA|nr:allantoin racemase [Acinetobacter calcoaceticus]
MRIQIINPNNSLEMTASIRNSAILVASKETEIIAVCPALDQSVASIEGHYDEAVATVALLKLLQQGCDEDVDGHIIACFGDPGLHAARELVHAPVIGIAEAAFHVATLVATKFTIITTLSRTKIIAEHLLHQYGFAHKCARIRCIDLPVLSLEYDENHCYQIMRQQCLDAKRLDGIGAIVLGCGGMSKMAQQLSDEISLPVIDGVTAAVKLIEGLSGLGMKTSKWGDYDYPRLK